MKPDTYTQIRARLARRRRRFLLVATASLAMLAAALGVSFAGPTGLTDVTVTSASNDFVFPVGTGGATPLGLGTFTTSWAVALRYTGTTGFTGGNATTAPTFSATAANVKTPSWAPVAGAAGSVTTPGDLALIDARNVTLGANFTALRVTVFITNLAPLQASYSSFAYPLNVYACASACDTPADETANPDTQTATYNGDWPLLSPYSRTAPVYVTNTDGFVSFSLPKGSFYVIAMNSGGSFYTLSTAGTLAPQFYFTAQAT